MAAIKKGILFIFDIFSGKDFDRETYHIHTENHRLYGQLEEQNIFMCEEREAHKHISSLKFMV